MYEISVSTGSSDEEQDAGEDDVSTTSIFQVFAFNYDSSEVTNYLFFYY